MKNIIICFIVLLFTSCLFTVKQRGNINQLKNAESFIIDADFDQYILYNNRIPIIDPSTDIVDLIKNNLLVIRKPEILTVISKATQLDIEEINQFNTHFNRSFNNRIRALSITEELPFTLDFRKIEPEELNNNLITTDLSSDLTGDHISTEFFVKIKVKELYTGEFNLIENIPTKMLIELTLYNDIGQIVTILEKDYNIPANIEYPYERKRIDRIIEIIIIDILTWLKINSK